MMSLKRFTLPMNTLDSRLRECTNWTESTETSDQGSSIKKLLFRMGMKYIVGLIKLFRVQDVITKRRKVIYDALEVAATLDSLISLAVAAAQHNWIRPRFSDQGVINIEDARQPITEKVQPCFVPNDIK